jgi:hypothetical protein
MPARPDKISREIGRLAIIDSVIIKATGNLPAAI